MRLLPVLLSALLLSPHLAAVHAQTFVPVPLTSAGVSSSGTTSDDETDPNCMDDMYAQVNREQRLFRAVLYGEKEPRLQPINAVLFDKKAIGWLKTARNEWKTFDEDEKGTTRSDAEMLEQWETDPLCESDEERVRDGCVELPRRGILETRKALTSELISRGILPSVRALECRLASVCAAVGESAFLGEEDADETVETDVPGCEPMTLPRMYACGNDESRQVEPPTDECEQVVAMVLRHEYSAVELAASYDSYRSYLQIAGIFDTFSAGFSQAILDPLVAAIKSMRTFSRIPCFVGQCDE